MKLIKQKNNKYCFRFKTISNMKFSLLKQILLLASIHISFITFAQNTTSSPYSMFGLGEIESKGNIRSEGMGGVGVAFGSESSINILNPASYTGIDKSAFTFELAGMGKISNMKSSSMEETVNDGNLSYVSFGFKTKDWWAMSFGLQPYSSIGYKINNSRIIEGTDIPYSNTIEGLGGINRLYVGNSFKYRNLSFGVNASVLFGSITLNEVNEFDLSNINGVETESTYYLQNVFFDYGLLYKFKLGRLKYSVGATFTNEQNLVSEFESKTLSTSGELLRSEEDVAKSILIPQHGSAGLAIEIPNRLIFALDYSLQDWSESIFYSSSAEYKVSQDIRFGIEYKPERLYNKSYFRFMDYRIGAHYSDSYLELYGIPIVEKGVSVGFGLPFRNLKFDLSLEYGTKGSTQNNLIKEDYYKVKFGIIMKQQWFQKRKFH